MCVCIYIYVYTHTYIHTYTYTHETIGTYCGRVEMELTSQPGQQTVNKKHNTYQLMYTVYLLMVGYKCARHM